MNIKKLINEILSKIINEDEFLDIKKNMEPAKYFGSEFGQDIEPNGTYVTKGHTNVDGWINGKAKLKNPLYIEVNDNNLIEYKRILSKKYKAKGKQLTNKLMKKGYDSIITKYPDGNYGEIILFPNAEFILA